MMATTISKREEEDDGVTWAAAVVGGVDQWIENQKAALMEERQAEREEINEALAELSPQVRKMPLTIINEAMPLSIIFDHHHVGMSRCRSQLAPPDHYR